MHHNADNAGPKGDAMPKRVITIAPNSAEIICALGGCDQIIAVSKFCVYPPELKGREKIGGLFDPDLEKIVALRPDLLVLRGHNEAIEKLCAERGIDLYHDRTDTLGDVEKTIVELGTRFGTEHKATKLVAKMRQQLSTIRQRVADQTKPRVLLVYARQPDRLTNLLTTGPGTFLHEMIEIAGGINLYADQDMRYPQISLESIVARRPDVIIELLPEVKMTPGLERRMREQWHGVGSFPAVTSNRIHFLTDDHGLIPSPRYVEIIEKVSRLLHPEDHDHP
jgi:iron complex transport system substrate-binding protein